MRKRAELVDETRHRITEATARLHTTIGPAATTIAAIAEEAGVTRLTVYRHFPDLDQLFAACQAHWLGQHPPPDPTAWLAIADSRERARRGLDELYRWYASNADAIYAIYRDPSAVPDTARRRSGAALAARVSALLGGDGSDRSARHRAAAGHVADYWTWRSLAVGQGLPHDDVVDLAVRFLLAAEADDAGGGRRSSMPAS